MLQYLPMSPEKGTTLSGHASYRWSKKDKQDSIPNDSEEQLKQLTVWCSRSHLGNCSLLGLSIQAVFKVRALCKGRGCGKSLVSYAATAWCFSDLTFLRKLSGMAPAETADPNYDFFQGQETPLGQTGSNLSA